MIGWPHFWARPEIVSSAYQASIAFLNSTLGLGLVSALFGSFAGAYGAQWIAERESEKRRALAEIRAANLAIALCNHILNTALSLKRQHIGPMRDTYNKERDRISEQFRLKDPSALVQFTADWETLPVLPFAFDQLRTAMFEKMNFAGKTIPLLSLAEGAASTLQQTIIARNDFIEEVRKAPPPSPEQALSLYFGIKINGGKSDRRYFGLMSALYEYCDATIVFLYALLFHLIEYGDVCAKEFGRKSPRIMHVDMEPALKAGLLPNLEEYEPTLSACGVSWKGLMDTARTRGAASQKALLTKVLIQAAQLVTSKHKK